jgi:hypothetical protein
MNRDWRDNRPNNGLPDLKDNQPHRRQQFRSEQISEDELRDMLTEALNLKDQ